MIWPPDGGSRRKTPGGSTAPVHAPSTWCAVHMPLDGPFPVPHAPPPSPPPPQPGSSPPPACVARHRRGRGRARRRHDSVPRKPPPGPHSLRRLPRKAGVADGAPVPPGPTAVVVERQRSSSRCGGGPRVMSRPGPCRCRASQAWSRVSVRCGLLRFWGAWWSTLDRHVRCPEDGSAVARLAVGAGRSPATAKL